MHADYSVELGREDPALELPWSSPDGAARYYDLKRNPDLVLQIPEALRATELSSFLTRINATGFPLQTAKCDLWFSKELSGEEEIFAAAGKFVSYIDLVFSETAENSEQPLQSPQARPPARRSDLAAHEALVKNLCTLLKRAPEITATVELVIRRCYYRRQDDPEKSDDGFCITTYVSGFGEDETEARRSWSIALTLLQHALVQVVQR